MARSHKIKLAMRQLLRKCRGWRHPGIRIINYHYVSAKTSQQFAKHLDYFMQHYQVISLQECCQSIVNQQLPKRPSLVITFDDGYKKVFDHAVPLLLQRKLPATFFICSDFISDDEMGTASYRDFFKSVTPDPAFTDKMMRWQELRQLLQYGFEIGCHSATHPYLARLTDQQLDYEVRQAKAKLEATLNHAVSSFAIPYGQFNAFNPQVLSCIQQAGFACALTNLFGVNEVVTNPYQLYRISLLAEMPLWQVDLRIR